MLIVNHLALGILSSIDLERYGRFIAGMLYPDAVRKYTKSRPVTHFEQGISEDNISYWSFPDMRSTEEEVQSALNETGYMSPDPLKGRLGGITHLDAFVECNQHLDSDMFTGIYCHLVQDCLYDKFIRDIIRVNPDNLSHYKVYNNDYTDDELSPLLKIIGAQETLILASALYKEQSITYNNEWIKENIAPILYSEYPEDLADTTLNYIYLPKELDEVISNHNFNSVSDTFMLFEDYIKLYAVELKATSKIYSTKEEYCSVC